MTSLELRPYQRQAVDEAHALYGAGHRRVTVALPCGTGKTLVTATVLAGHERVVVFVPTVALLAQTVAAYQQLTPGRRLVAVCSARASVDRYAGDVDRDELELGDLGDALAGVEPTTDPQEIAAAVCSPSPVTVVSTYASAPVVAEAAESAGVRWDLVVCDEAHRTAGAVDKAWALPLDEERFPAERRLFTTATTRMVSPPEDEEGGQPVEVASMDDPALYGPVFAPLTVRQAIDGGWLADYQVAVVAVQDSAVAEVIAQAKRDGHLLDRDAAAAQLALLRAADTHPDLDSVLVFHNRVAHSRAWCAQMRALAGLDPAARETRVFHIDAGSAPGHRTAALNALAHPHGRLSVVSNCRVLAEGIDVPSLAAVLLAAPRTSSPDITQIVGRALRRHPEHPERKALIVLPVVQDVGDTADVDTQVARTGYVAAWQVLTALAEDDPLLYTALLQIRAAADLGQPAPTAATQRVQLDAGLLPANLADGFALNVMSRTTSGLASTAYRLADYYARTGSASPKTSYVTADGFPLGRRVSDARRSYRQGRLHPRLVELFEQIPGFTWASRRGRQASTVEWMLDLVERHTQITGVRTIQLWETTRDPETGRRIQIGRWVHEPPKLTEHQRHRLDALAAAGG
ncbi:DEAD/DEAH box helicase family protein [Dietzia sp. 179-F 9C3 NHS]|uniref:DEAD/DEAH box helicase family protein n=1 Tax=Dietzia sp. 179-F 9C3 NHS TaxID=3374295 RepID=UPI00387A2DEC